MHLRKPRRSTPSWLWSTNSSLLGFRVIVSSGYCFVWIHCAELSADGFIPEGRKIFFGPDRTAAQQHTGGVKPERGGKSPAGETQVLPPERIEPLPTEVHAIDVHCVFLAFDGLAFHLCFLAGMPHDLVLILDLENLALIVDQDHVSGLIGTVLVAGRMACALGHALGITQPPSHFGRFARVLGIERYH